ETGPQTQLERPEHARCEHDLLGTEELAPRPQPRAGTARLDLPAAVDASQQRRLPLGMYPRAALFCEQQVVAVERVLGAVAAADHASAAAHAEVEVHRHGRAAERVLRAHS